MNHADFWVMPSARASSWLEIPFLLLAMSQTAGSHLSSPSGESSKIVPTLTLVYFQRRRVLRNENS
jgi:hypothetical protein